VNIQFNIRSVKPVFSMLGKMKNLRAGMFDLWRVDALEKRDCELVGEEL